MKVGGMMGYVRRLLIAATVTGLLSGCSSDNSDLQEFMSRVALSTPPPIEPYPEFKPIPAFQYTAQEQRSPFTRPRSQALALQDQRLNNCTQPNVNRAKESLEAYGIDALQIQGFFTSKGRNWVLIAANDGTLHRATTGNYLGLFFGKITDIQEKTIFFTEQLPDGAGCWKEKRSKLTLSDGSGEVTNV